MAKHTKPAAVKVPLKLQGKTVFLAGNFYGHDQGLQNLIDLEGGAVGTELTDKTDFMVLGYSGMANPRKKAAKLNVQGGAIQVVTIDQLHQLIRPTPDEAVQLLLSGPKGIERWNRHNDAMDYLAGFGVNTRQPRNVAYLRGADFSRAKLANANFSIVVVDCDFTGADLTGCHLNLSRCNLKSARLDGVVSLGLAHCAAEKVDFSEIATEQASFDSSNLTGSRFAKLALRDLRFVKCQLDGADLSGTRAVRSQFRNCSMANATLVDADLDQTDFFQADLRGANLRNANLKLAKFTGANVDGADFTGATMVGADVAGVDFAKAKGFNPSQVKTKGKPGAAVTEFVQVAAKAQRISTSFTVAQGKQVAILTIDFYPQWTHCSDSVGSQYQGAQQHSQTASASQWASMAAKWHGATPDLASVTVRSTKAPMANKETKQLALRAWCELFGVAPPSAEDLKKAASSAKTHKNEKAQAWLERLRSGKKAVKEWNDNVVALSKVLTKVADVNLANAQLGGIDLRSVEWNKADVSGADLTSAQVWGCKFPEADFSGASFKRAQLHSAFNDAKLENADFTGASAAGSSFKRANCKNVQFKKADLQRVDLCGADLTGADLTGATLTQASYDEHTRWPKGFTPTLEMIWKGPGTSPAAHKLVQSTKPKGKLDTDQFMKRLEELTDAAKLSKALAMLKADRFRLYAQVQNDHFVGVVKSQSDADLVYSCRLNSDGTYACCTQNLNVCGGLRGSLCKHLLVLIVGLTKSSELDPNAIDTWIRLSKTNKPALDKEAMSETFLRYKGAEAGEVDWRPTETIPEDYYAM